MDLFHSGKLVNQYFFFIKFHISMGNSNYCYLEPFTLFFFFYLRSYFRLYLCTYFFMSTHKKKLSLNIYQMCTRLMTKLSTVISPCKQNQTSHVYVQFKYPKGQLNLSFKFAGHEKGRLTHYNRTEMLDKLKP